MNKRFFKQQITVYHFEKNETVSRMHFDEIYFRHNKKSNQIDKLT